LGYAGSEEFIRLQFEEYLLALLAAVKYKQFLLKSKDPSALMTEIGEKNANYFHYAN
jgi:hypothetical protein